MAKHNCKGRGSLYIRGKYYWAKWMYHGTMHYQSTGVPTDLTNSKGTNIARTAALKVLDTLTEPFRHRNSADVLALLARRIECEHNADINASDPFKVSPPLKDLGELFKSSTRRNDITEDHLGYYVSTANEFAEFIGPDTPASNIHEKQTAAWADHLWASNLTPHTFNGKISMMRQIWKTLMPTIGTRNSPWEGIKKKKKDTYCRKVFADEQISAVYASAADRYRGDLRTMICIGEHTGMRIGDCATLKWDDVDFKTGMIRVTTHKTGEKVSIPMLPNLLTALTVQRERLTRDYAAAKKYGWKSYWLSLPGKNQKERESYLVDEDYTDYVCPRMAVRQVKQKTLLCALMRRTIMNAGMETAEKTERGVHKRPVFGFHSLRHGLASKLAQAGVPIEFAKKLLGHRSTAVHEHYIHIDEESLKTQIQKLA